LYFGDLPLDEFARLGSGAEPWQSFERARAFLAEGNRPPGLEALQAIGLNTAIESRVRLQAWHSFREAGGQAPPSVANDVLGVVVEVGMSEGQDFLAAYADRTAYYYNYAGGAMVWLRPDASLDKEINSVLGEASRLAPLIGPWKEPRRPSPSAGIARLNILVHSSLLFGEAPMQALDRDKHARPLLRAATALMARVTNLRHR
jgi:hypothetical protein